MKKSLLALFFCFALASSFTLSLERNRSGESESDDDWFGVSGSLRGRKGKGSKSEVDVFGSGRLDRLSFGQRETRRGTDSDFDLEAFVGIGETSVEVGDLPDKKDGKPRPKAPAVIETESEAHVDQDGKVSAGGVSGVAAGEALGSVDLESKAGVNERRGFGFGRSSAGTRAGSSAEKGKTSEKATIGAVGARVSSMGLLGGSGDGSDDLFVSSSLSRRGEDSKVSGRTDGFGGSSGSFGISFEKEDEEEEKND